MFFILMDKRGFIKTLEAVLAVIIVFIFIYSISDKTDTNGSRAELMRDIQENLLLGISNDDDFRKCIVSAPVELLGNIGTGSVGGDVCEGVNGKSLKGYIENTLPGRFKSKYAIGICEVGNCDVVTPNNVGKYVYTSAVVISSELEVGNYAPKILRIWVWYD